VKIERSIDIQAPPELVWGMLSDVVNWPAWTPTVQSVEMLSPGPMTPGTRVRIRQPRLPVAVWTVTALETGTFFEWQNRSTGLVSTAGHRVTSDGAGSRVSLVLEWAGFLTPLVRVLYGKLAGEYVETEARSLKQRCERQP
jgi:carbon monoxide dehydrogenase subunit G